MADTTKYVPIGGTTNNGNLHKLDFKNIFTILKTKTTVAFVYAFMLVFIAFTLFLAFSPSPTITSSPSSSTSQFSSIFSYFFPNTTTFSQPNNTTIPFDPFQNNTSITRSTNATSQSHNPNTSEKTINSNITTVKNSSHDAVPVQTPIPSKNNTSIANPTSQIVKKQPSLVTNHTSNSDETKAMKNSNQTTNATVEAVPIIPNKNLSSDSSLKGVDLHNYTASLARKQNNGTNKYAELMESLMKCDFFDGEWVKDDSYPLYKPGSCSIIDEQFNCIRNGRPDKDYQKYKWKPKGCSLPRYLILFNFTNFLDYLMILILFVFEMMNVFVWFKFNEICLICVGFL